jgi:hypothetical protein
MIFVDNRFTIAKPADKNKLLTTPTKLRRYLKPMNGYSAMAGLWMRTRSILKSIPMGFLLIGY